jgi:hypothetical protein
MIVCWSIIRYIAVFREIVILSRSEGSLVREAQAILRCRVPTPRGYPACDDEIEDMLYSIENKVKADAYNRSPGSE